MPVAIRLNPFLAFVAARTGRAQTPRIDAVLQPAETEAVLPPVLLAGQLDRVTATDEHSTLKYHLDTLQARTEEHAPLIRFRLENVLVGFNGFASRRHAQRYSPSLFREALSQPLRRVARLRCCHDYVSWRYFGHWLTDALPMAAIDEDLADLWLPHPPAWQHCASYASSLNLHPVAAPLIQADEFYCYQDFGQGSHKRARHARLRSALQARFGGSGGPDHVFISRGATGVARMIANEAAIADDLRRRNWTILDISTATMPEIQRCLCAARVVVGIDGSHLDHAHLSLRHGGVMVILIPGDRFSTRQLGVCRAHGVTPAFVVLTGSAGAGYHLDLDELLKTTDLALAQADRNS